MIKINAGWIVDGLIIAQPGKQVLQGGSNKGGNQQTFVLEPDEVIDTIDGANCYFDNTQVTGQVTIVTNKRQLGPFGHSGNPNGTEQHLIFRRFSLPINNVQLSNDRRKNQHLGPINI